MKIKTRESLRTIKTFDRAKTLGQKVKNGAGEVKEYGEELQNTRYGSANEYAGNAVENTERRTARNTAYGAGKIGNWGLKETRKNLLKWRNRPKKFKVKVQQPKQLPAPKRPALPPAKTTAKTAQKGVKTAQQTAKAAAKTAKVTVKAAQRAAQAAKAAAKAAVKFVKVAAKAIVAAVKATVAAVKGIVAAIAAGGWIAVVVILVIVIIWGVIAAVCGVFMPNDTGSYSVVYMMSACDSEYDARELEIVNNTPHDYLIIEGHEASKKDVIAVFAVLTNSMNKDLSELNSELLDEFRAVFNSMNTVEHYTSTSEETVIRDYTDAEGNPYQVEETVVKTTLHIEYTSMTASQGADVYHFNEKQREQLNTLLSSDFDELWAGILGQ